MKTNSWISVSLATVLALSLGACSDDDDNDGGPTKSVTATVSAGNPVDGSECSIAPFNNPGNVLDTATSNANGIVFFEIPEATGLALIKCVGGTFTPKATAGELATFLANNATEVAANPLTTLIAQVAQSAPGTFTSLDDFEALAESIFVALGLPTTVSVEELVSGTAAAEDAAVLTAVAATLAADPGLLDDLVDASVAGSIPPALAQDFADAVAATVADPTYSGPDVPANDLPDGSGGSVITTGGAGG